MADNQRLAISVYYLAITEPALERRCFRCCSLRRLGDFGCGCAHSSNDRINFCTVNSRVHEPRRRAVASVSVHANQELLGHGLFNFAQELAPSASREAVGLALAVVVAKVRLVVSAAGVANTVVSVAVLTLFGSHICKWRSLTPSLQATVLLSHHHVQHGYRKHGVYARGDHGGARSNWFFFRADFH